MSITNFIRRIVGTASFPRLKRQAKPSQKPDDLKQEVIEAPVVKLKATINPVTKTHPLRRKADKEPVEPPPADKPQGRT